MMNGSSDNPPSAASQIAGRIPDASSNTYHEADPRACCPWYASAFSGAQEIGAHAHCARRPVRYMILLLTSNHGPVRHRFVHSMTAAHVFPWSCPSVLAVTLPRQSGRVDISQSTIHATNADFPQLLPLEIAF